MDRLQAFLDNPHGLSGTAAVVADGELTILAADRDFVSLTGDAGQGPSALSSLLEPASAARLADLLSRAPRTFEWDGALLRADRKLLVHLSATRMRDVARDGAPLYLAVFIDQHGVEEVRRSAAFEKRKYDLIADMSEDIPFEYDYGTDTIVYSPKYRDTFGSDPVIPRFLERLLAGEIVDPVGAGFGPSFLSMASEDGVGNIPECFLPTASGGKRWYALFRTTLRDGLGNPVKAVGALRDIDRQKREQLRLLDKSRSDAMTGLFNKVTTEEEIRIALRDARPGSLGVLFMIDIDNFKNVNDNMGHLAGDSILVEIARQLGRTFRQGDVIGRVGGDEFHVYMRDVREPASIRERAQELCSSIRRLFMDSRLDNAISISVGIAVTDHPIPYDDLFRQADVALYRAKGNGKNRYEFFGQNSDGETGQPSSPLALHTVRNSIMVDIIDILFSMCDIREGVDKALEFVGNALRVDKIVIFENSLDGKTVSMSHEWSADPKWREKERFQNVPAEELSLPEPSDSSGVYYCSDLAGVPAEEKSFLHDPSITSLLHCDIRREGRTVGHIGFEERGGRRIWTQQEVDALILMSRIIGEYIRQRRSSTLLRESAEATRAILDGLPRTAVYVIDSNHRIVYFNRTVADAYPDTRIGMTCFDVFWGRNDICSFCPVAANREQASFTSRHAHSPFKGLVDISVSQILWENRHPAHIVMLSEHAPTDGERRERERCATLVKTLCASYHHVLDIDVETGQYANIAGEPQPDAPLTGDYARQFEASVERVLPRYRKDFREAFGLPGLRDLFTSGAKERHLEYAFNRGDGPHWRRRLAVPYRTGAGERRVLQCIRDIDDQKRIEDIRRQEEENLRIALQNSYAKVYRISLDANRLTCLFCNVSLLGTIDVTGRYDEDIRTVMESRVHPRDRAAFLAFFRAEHLLEGLERGGELSVEYRKLALDGTYHWMLALVVPLPGRHGEAVALVRDVTESKERQDNYLLALQNNYAEIFRLDIARRTISPLFTNAAQVVEAAWSPDFDVFVRDRAVDRVHPDSLGDVSDFYGRRLFERLARGETPELEYRKRLSPDGPYRWLSATVQPLPGNKEHALLLIRDITETKDEETNYLLALQSNYTEIFRLDLLNGQISAVYYNSAQVSIPADSMSLDAFVRERGDGRVHPDQLAAVKDFYRPANILERLKRGDVPELEYRKRQIEDGPYRWVAATIRPLPGSEDQALLLLRDVTDLRDEETNFYKVLQRSYTEIYEISLDADTVRVIHREDSRFLAPRLSFRFWEDTLSIAETSVHPEDREAFLAHYSPDNIRRRLAEDPRLELEYRLRTKDGSYRWMASLLLPLPGNAGKLLILGQDIDARKRMEKTAARLERRQSAVLRQSGDCIIEIDMHTWRFTRSVSASHLGLEPRQGDFRDFYAKTVAILHPDDVERISRSMSPEALEQARRSHCREITDQYRVLISGEYLWLENRIFFLVEGEDATAFFILRDISDQKRLEEERAREEERFNLALRNTYTEIYEIDIYADTPHLVYANETHLIRVDRDPHADIHSVAETLIHPEDRGRFLAAFSGTNIRKEFAAGRQEVPAEYRRLGDDGNWYWVSAAIVPICGHDACRSDRAMLLVRDISEDKRREQRQRISDQYDHALRNIYDELYELNVTQDTYRIVYHVEGKYVSPDASGSLSGVIDLVSREMIHPDDRERFLDFFDLDAVRRSFASGREYRIGEFRKLWHDKAYHWASITVFPVAQPEGGDEIYLAFIMDIGDRKQAEEIAQQNVLLERQRLDDERYRTIVEQTDTLVFEWNLETGTRYLSPELVERFAGNYDDRDLIRVWLDDKVIHSEDLPLLTNFIYGIRTRAYTEMTARFRRRDGSFIWCKAALTCLRGPDGKPKRYIGTLNDVDNATRSVLALKYRAEYDLLTDLYNMHTFYSRTAQELRAHPDRQYSIIRMDIDRFKVINDLYGLKEGDKLLIFIAGLLREKMAGHGVYGRLSGDVFCMCVDYPRDRILRLIRELTDRLADYPLPYKVVPSFGICEVDNIDTPINVLCDWANLALKTIKGNYLNSYAFYDGKLREKILEEKTIENQMHDALLQGQFVLYLQPKVHIPTSRIIGSEGLVRWLHPVEGLMPPDRFIPLFEKNGFIIRLDEYIWEQACITLRRWLDHGLTPTPISVNMSRMHIHDPRLREKLLGLMQRYDLPPRLLELELTESAFLENESGLFQAMKELQNFGFQFSMDDFGSGYSSLNMLKSMPVDFIKIDRGFLNEVVTTDRGKTVIRFSISLAKEMNIKVIAEGVENEEQAAFLLQAGCAYAQGYFYSKPLPVPAFEELAFSGKAPFPVAPGIRAISERLEKNASAEDDPGDGNRS